MTTLDLPKTLSEAQREITRLRKDLDAAQQLAMFESEDLVAVYIAGRSNALDEAAKLCCSKSAEWDDKAKTHVLKEWSINIGCAHVGHAYEAAINALKKESSHVTPCLANRQANA